MAAKSVARNRSQTPRARAAQRPRWWRNTRIALAIVLLVFLSVTAFLGFKFMMALNWADSQIPSLYQKLNGVAANTTVMLARDGKTVLYAASAETRDPVTDFKEIPDSVKYATLAAEDRRYMDHSGVDYRALLRSLFTDVRERRSAQGGSTITMQLAKRLYSSSEKTLDRKLRDVALAIKIEKRLSKEEILKDYLNEVYYGQGAYGIRAAADVYFKKKDLNKLSIGEAALLARLVRRPSEENPYRAPKKAIANRNDVLLIERQEGWITDEQYRKAVNEKLKLAPKRFGSGEQIYQAPYFVRYVLDCLHRDMPDVDFKSGGYTIETTLDPALEKSTESAVSGIVAKYRRSKVTTAAMVVMNANGEILSMVGGTDFEKHQYNVIAQGHRQPGSSFKPIVYSAALSTGVISPGDSISSGPFTYTDPTTGESWSPDNDNGFGGNISIRSAIAGSVNTCAARVCEKVGPQTVVSYAHDVFGYTSPIRPFMSIALGTEPVSPLEQAQAYSIFMLHGDRATPFGITRVVAPDGTVARVYQPEIRKNMLDPEVAAQMDQYLRAVVTGGTAWRALAARPVEDARGKTGTTQENRDAWFCGYTNNLLGIGWTANEQYDKNHKPPYYYEPMNSHVFGGTVTTEMWAEVMRAAQKKYGTGAPQPPKHMDRQNMDVESDSRKPITVDESRDDSTDQDNSDTPAQSTPPEKAAEPKPSSPPTETPSEPGQNPPDQQGEAPQPPPAEPEARPPPAHTPKPRNRAAPPVVQNVTVEICADTGLLATAYCPETVSRTYPRGQQPKKYCTKHGP